MPARPSSRRGLIIVAVLLVALLLIADLLRPDSLIRSTWARATRSETPLERAIQGLPRNGP